MKYVLVVITALFLLPQIATASKNNSIKGGFGFLYPDFNLQNNAGQLVAASGSAFEVGYVTQSESGSTMQGLVPSLVYSNGRVALGVHGSRVGTGFGSDESTDTVGGSLGLALGKGNKFNVGVGYSTSIESGATDSGTISGGLNMNPGKGAGIAVGVGVSTVLGASTTAPIAAKAAVGYNGKNRNNNLEVVYALPDVESFDDYTLGVYGNMGDKGYYIGAGYEMASVSGATSNNLLGRVGLVLSSGRSTGFDISAQIRYDMDGVNDPAFGGTARISF